MFEQAIENCKQRNFPVFVKLVMPKLFGEPTQQEKDLFRADIINEVHRLHGGLSGNLNAALERDRSFISSSEQIGDSYVRWDVDAESAARPVAGSM